MAENFTIREASGVEDMKTARHLIEQYMAELGEDLCFQGVNEELDNLPHQYARPDGVIYFATLNDGPQPTAMIALKKLDDNECEMKRLFVTPEHRKHGMGESLVKTLIAEAKRMSYQIMRLDTLERLKPAISLYERHGFIKTKAYNDADLEGITYFMKKL